MTSRNTKRRPSLGALVAVWIASAAIAGLVAYPARAQPVDDLDFLEEQAMRRAVEEVAPSVVRIETVGGLARLGNVLFGTGPTTGLVVSEDGYIISSAFNFAQKPASILIGLPDGTRTPATLVATDKSRMLVLLKININEKLTVPRPVPAGEMMVGQWSIAVGRTFEGGEPNMSVGIISALDRIWGKAIQTDAKVSPSNYGGPLVDIRGRVLGVLVPLSPTATGQVAGVQWYDSGIGFAIPLEHINDVLSRLKEGKDLLPGIIGVSLKGRNMYSDPAEIAVVRPNSPAYKAGLKAGDKIVEIDGQAITRQVQLRHQIQQKYAGDTVHMVVLRGEDRIELDLELIDRLEPYQHPFLGVLPMRTPSEEGVVVRYVYPGSAAAKAGILAGDRITQFGGQPVAGAQDILDSINGLSVASQAALAVVRGDETLELQATLTGLPLGIPDSLPPPRAEQPASEQERPQTGTIAVKIPEFKNECLAYVPENYDPQIGYGVAIWLHAPGGTKEEELLARWRDQCESADLILLAPKSADPALWRPTEMEFIRKTLDNITSTYNVDPSRVVVHGHQGGASMAYLVGFNHRDVIRAVAAVDGQFAGRPTDNDPLQRLAFYITTAKRSRFARRIDAGIRRLKSMKYPVTVVDQGEEGRYLTDLELAGLVRWIDSLDRL